MGFHIISQKPLREFWKIHPKAEGPLKAWFKIMKAAQFSAPDAIRRFFGEKVDQVKQFTVFDVGGNKYRLITVIDFERHKVLIRAILTHKEYDKGKWKTDRFGRGQPRPNGKPPETDDDA